MAVSDVESVLEFLRKNGFAECESALMEDILEKSQVGTFDFERFLFPMVPPPPPVKIPATRGSPEMEEGGDDGAGDSSSASSEEEFVSLGSSTTDLCSSEFTNPYGIRTATGHSSQASSDRLSQFGTARDYPDFDMQNDLYWYKEKDEDYAMPPQFGDLGSFGGPSEDKFIMTVETGKQSGNHLRLGTHEVFKSAEGTDCLDEQWHSTSVENAKENVFEDYHDLNDNVQKGRLKKVQKEQDGWMAYSCSSPLCACCGGEGKVYRENPAENGLMNLQDTDASGILNNSSKAGDRPMEYGNAFSNKRNSIYECFQELNSTSEFDNQVLDKHYYSNERDNDKSEDNRMQGGETPETNSPEDDDGGGTSDELLMYGTNEEEYEVFSLRIIHRKNRTGFEENKDFPIVLNSIIAGRYYVAEYLGSAAFSKVVQAHDFHTGIDVCLKIIKNDKDFFDQSLDEIKLLKLVNKHDPGDQRHILRLYDYFYHQEHLFIVCELLRANLYEFQKYNRESGGEAYFTMSRLQFIMRQCLEALEYLHSLGIIHCDLKPENILIKSYRRCEIKVIDLGSSCFQTDNLSLYVQSRSYRAPEVILGLPYDQKIDLWSLGCILAELWSGEVLFPNEAVVMLLARVVGMLGPIDMDMLLKGQETQKYFTKEYDLYYLNEETNELEYIIPEESSLEHQLQVSDPLFIDFLQNLLEINPQRRPTAREALEHAWLSYPYDSGTC